jgi:hypothetical protein
MVEAVQCPERREEAFLDGVAGFLFLAQEPAGHGEETAAVLADQALKGVLVSAAQSRDEIALGALFVARSRRHVRVRRHFSPRRAERIATTRSSGTSSPTGESSSAQAVLPRAIVSLYVAR